MNTNQQLKKYFRRQVENLMFLYTSSLLDGCHMENKVLSKYIDRYGGEQINMLKKLQEDLTDDYNTNLCILYKRLFDFKNPTTYFLKNLVGKPPLELIRRLREENNPHKKLKVDDLSHYLKGFLHDSGGSNEWTTFFKDYKSLYYSVYSCLMLYQKDKENFLDFLEHYLLTFITIQIIFDTLEQIKEKNYYQYLIKPRLMIEQTRKILGIITIELENKIGKETLQYCYKNVKRMLKISNINFEYRMKYLSEYVLIEKDIKKDVQSFDPEKFNQFPIYVRSYEELQGLNKSLNYQKYVSDIIETFKGHEEKVGFSRIEKDDNYVFYKKLTSFAQIIGLDDMLRVNGNSLQELRFKNNNYENVKKEIDTYIENMLSLYEQGIKQSIGAYCDDFNFISKTKNGIDVEHFGELPLRVLDRMTFFKDYMFLNDMGKRYSLDTSRGFIDCDTGEIKKGKEQEFFDYIFENDILIDCYNVNCSHFENYLKNSSRILGQQYFFIKLFDYLLDEKNNNGYLYNILYCIMYSEEFHKVEEDELKTLFSMNYVKYNILNCLDMYYDDYFNKETKEEMRYTNNEIKKNYLTMSKQLLQLKKLLSKKN